MSWLVPRNSLTPYQERAVELKPDLHRIILGAPGSGKTMVLLHRACYLRSVLNVPDNRFKIFVFNNVLKTYIKSAFELLGLPEECILTFDKWCMEYHRVHISKKLPKVADTKYADYPAIRRAVLNHIKSFPSSVPRFDFVMVDEGQDLDGVAFEIVRCIASHVTVCMDHKQRIYEQGSNEAEIATKLGVCARNLHLLDAFRCCPYIAKIASQLIPNAEEREQYLNQVRIDQGARQTPLLYYVYDYKDEMRRLVEIIKTRQQMGDKIAILFHFNKHVYGYAKGLEEAGVPVEVPKARADSDYFQVDFNSDKPKILTLHGAKGLTFDTIIMPQLTKRFFLLDAQQIDRLLFVGITRATKWVYMSSTEKSQLPALLNLHHLEKEGCLTIQRPDVSVTGQPGLPGFGPIETPQVNFDDVEDDDMTGIL